tara:strand:+ start:449 stop:898 length:450 start_codon:yes stop_codon:yes gene_type:complete
MKQLRKKEIKELNEKIKDMYKLDDFFDKKGNVNLEDDSIIYENEVYFFYYEDKLIPSLKLLQKNNFLPSITVDMGAIKFVVSGADIMRPGITKISNFEKNAIISIIDETHGKVLAVGIALLSSTDLEKEEKGKYIKNIHFIGDKIFNKS